MASAHESCRRETASRRSRLELASIGTSFSTRLAFAPAARAVVLVAGGVGKLAYFAAWVALVVEGTGTGALLAAGFADLLFAGLFAAVVFTTVQPIPSTRAAAA